MTAGPNSVRTVRLWSGLHLGSPREVRLNYSYERFFWLELEDEDQVSSVPVHPQQIRRLIDAEPVLIHSRDCNVEVVSDGDRLQFKFEGHCSAEFELGVKQFEMLTRNLGGPF